MTADERIAELRARSGQPVMVAKKTEETEEEKRVGAKNVIERILLEKYKGNVNDYIIYLVDTIYRLEAALSNVIKERDQLKKDLHEAATWKGFLSLCTYCAHKDADCFYEPCKTCIENSKRPNFEWRGVVKDEQDDESKSCNPA